MMVNIRPGVLADLETLVAFTRTEALEAEGLTLPEENVRVGVRAGLLDPPWPGIG